MRKLLLILILSFAAKFAASQVAYPIVQNLGNNTSTIVNTNAIKPVQGLILPSFVDTNAANSLPYLGYYTGAAIWSTSDSSIYVKQKSATSSFWFKIGGSGGGATGTFWNLTGNNLAVTPAGLLLGTNSADNLPLGTSGVQRVILPSTGLGYQNDTTNNKPMTFNTSTKHWGYGSWFGSGSGGQPAPVGYAREFSHSETTGNIWVQGVYPISTNFKKCLYEFWAEPYDSAEYMISTGYGGAHLILFGFTGGTTGRMTLTGNMWYNGANVVSLYGQDTIATNSVHIFTVAYDGSYVTTFIDGVPSIRTAYSGYRSVTSSPSDVDLFIGGSDHSKFDGLMFKCRGFETFESDIPIGTTTSYFPKTNWQSGNNPYFQYDFTAPNRTYVNQGTGLWGNEMGATINIGANFNEFQAGGAAGADTLSFPQLVQAVMYQTPYSGTLPTIGAQKIFDAFHRIDNVPVWSNDPNLDSTQGGSLGKKKWTMNTIDVAGGVLFAGVLSNAAYFNSTNWAYVTSNSDDDSILVTKATQLSEDGIYVYARRQDANNYIYLNYDVGSGYANLWNVVGGVASFVDQYAYNTNYSKITMVVNGNNCRVYEDGVLKISGANNISGTSGMGIGIGAQTAFVRISKFEVY